MTGTETLKENKTCNQCGRRMYQGDTAYWCLEGVASHLPIPGIGKMPKYFCSEGCLNEYKGSRSQGSDGGSLGGSTKIKYGISTRAKSSVVYFVLGIIGLIIFFGIIALIHQSCQDNSAQRAAKKMPAAEYVVDKSSVTLTGKFNEYFDVVDDINVVTKEGAYEAIVTLTVQCKKSLSSVIKNSDNIYLMFNYNYDGPYTMCITTPSAATLGATLYAMKAGEEKHIKIKIEPDSRGGKKSIEAYKNFLETAELGAMSLKYRYYDKNGRDL